MSTYSIFIFNQQLSISRLSISSNHSLEIDGTKWSGEVPEELRNTNGVNSSGFVYIIVVPGFLVSKSKEFFSLSSALGEVSAENLNGSSSSRIFSQIEFTTWFWVFTFIIYTFNSVVGNHVLSKFINWV